MVCKEVILSWLGETTQSDSHMSTFTKASSLTLTKSKVEPTEIAEINQLTDQQAAKHGPRQ